MDFKDSIKQISERIELTKYILLLIAILLTSCTSNPDPQLERMKTKIADMQNMERIMQEKIDSLNGQLNKYKEKYGEIQILDLKNKKFGIWQTHYYVDDFGEPTKKGYVYTRTSGVFSNSATTNSDLGVEFVIDKNSIRIQLYEYNSNHPIKGEGYINFKARRSDGKEIEFRAYNNDHGYIIVLSGDKELINFLDKGGSIKFIATTTKSRIISEYKFTLSDPSYLKEALDNI